MSAPWFRSLRRRLRFKRTRILIHSPETQKLVEQYEERVAREHRWVHRLEDRVEHLRVALQDVQGIALNGIANADTAQGRLDAIDSRVSTALAGQPNIYSFALVEPGGSKGRRAGATAATPEPSGNTGSSPGSASAGDAHSQGRPE